MKPVRVNYPWTSSLGAVVIVAWQFTAANPDYFDLAGWSPRLLRDEYLTVAVALLPLLVMFDFWLFFKANRRSRRQLQRYRDQIGELFDSKRELGTRARTYSDHADKLKMFISERLLEYIEYDEKFLHFKNIASEVRHNGVISYDKTQTALKKAQQQCDSDDAQQYREAADSLLYLWDLLDLSTTDNIALHVTNQIYDCEEHYFQSLLNDDASLPTPFEPTFLMSHALRRALLPITDNLDELGLNEWNCPGQYQDHKFSIDLRDELEMLGNVNHMVLLIENLLNNALFYAQQKKRGNRYSPVLVLLTHHQGDVEFRVYNRGPHIKEAEKDKIYQLGFSSRRVREHHGKGLGLYFVDQIVRGFEATIGFENIDNANDQLELSIKLANGELQIRQISIEVINGKPLCQQSEGADTARKSCEWTFDTAITNVEINRGSADEPLLISDIPRNQSSHYVDDKDPRRPRWTIAIENSRATSKLSFETMDLRGVEFIARFPSAKSRLDSQG